MNNKFLNKINLFLLLSIVLLVGAAQSVSALTRTVTKIQDTNDGVCNADCSLREAVDDALTGDIINFAPGLAGQDVYVTEGVITISGKSLIIAGQDNLTLTAEDQNRIFHIKNGALVSINNLAFTRGSAKNPDVLNFGGCGGAILAQGGTLEINNSEFFDNHSVCGGAVLASGGDLKIYNSVIRDNSSESCGGGLSVQSTTANAQISNSTFKFNTAKNGGAICVTNGKFKMTGTSVYQNFAVGSLFTSGGGLYLTGTNFSATNYQTDFLIENSSIYNNTAGMGGGIANIGNLTVINTTLSGNSAYHNEGGGLVHSTPGGIQNGLLTIRNSTITLNSAATGGGGVARFGVAGEFNFGNTVIAANNTNNNSAPEIKGTVNSLGYNFIGSTSGATVSGDLTGNQINPNPMLAPLAYNGGITKNHFPQFGSPLINTGSNALAVAPNGNPLATDQRGKPRFNLTVDIGAIEREAVRNQDPEILVP